MHRAFVFIGLLVMALGCGNDTPTTPSSGGGNAQTTHRVVVHPHADLGTFSASFQGRIFSVGPQAFDLAPGQYELTGQMRALGTAGAIFTALFTKSEVVGVPGIGPGGVAWNSVQSAIGPSPQPSSCAITYAFDGSGVRDFRIQFRVTASAVVGTYCP